MPKTLRILCLTAALFLTPAIAFAKPVLTPGEISVGAEFFPFNGLALQMTGLDASRVPQTSPSVGFNVRYAFDQRFALYGNLGFFHRIRKGTDPDTFYAVGGGAQFNAISSRLSSVLLRGGVQFLPRHDGIDQVLGVRFYAGPGVEARVAEALSLQIFSPLFDLQVGGQSTDLDINLLPSLGMFVYF